MTRRRLLRAKVVEIRLEEPLRAVEVAERYREVLLVVRLHGAVLAEITVPALTLIPVDVLKATIAAEVGATVWKSVVEQAFDRSARLSNGAPPRGRPTVSIVVCTRDRPQRLRECLESLFSLSTLPDEIVVIDNGSSDDSARRICAEFPVRYVYESEPGLARGRNRGIIESFGDVIAFTDDDCQVDPGWLNGLDHAFADPLLVGIVGYMGPLELETPAQYLFEAHGGFGRRFSSVVFDGTSCSPISSTSVGSGGNMILRRSLFEKIGLFSEFLGAGTIAGSAEDFDIFYRALDAGYRLLFDSGRVVWHRHRSEYEQLRTLLRGYVTGVLAFATYCLVQRRDVTALRLWAWWLFRHISRDLWRIVRRDERRVPLGLVLAELQGGLRAPWRLARSLTARRGIPPIELRKVPSSGDARGTRVSVREFFAVNELGRGAVGVAGRPDVSVVVSSYNRCQKLAIVLDGLGRQQYPSDRFEVVVVLDGSTDKSAEMVRSLDLPCSLRLVQKENSGASATRNRGAKEAAAALLLFLDDDVVPEAGMVAEHVRAHRAATSPHVALGYYPPTVTQTGLWPLVIRAWWEDHFRTKAEPGHRWTYIDLASGNISFPTSLYLEQGGFDEDFKGKGREDWEFGVRLLEEGIPFGYYPAACGRHYFDATLATGLRAQRDEAHLDILLASKHPHLQPHLPPAAIARMLGGGTYLPALFSYNHPVAGQVLARAARPLLRLLELAKLRNAYRSQAMHLVGLEYLLGLTEVLPTVEDLLAFVAPSWRRGTDGITVQLDQPCELELPQAAGSLELTVSYGSAPLTTLIVLDTLRQWEWRQVTRGVASAASLPLQQALLREAVAGSRVD